MTIDIDSFFSNYIYSWMFEDIEKMIKTGLNYPAALCISVYCEVLGKLKTQNFTIGNNKEKFDSFLPLLGQKYVEVDNELKKKNDLLYWRLRCGLAHDYFLKPEDVVSTRLFNGTFTGIIYDAEKDSLMIGLENFFNDFKVAAKCLHEDLKRRRSHIPTKLISISSQITIIKG